MAHTEMHAYHDRREGIGEARRHPWTLSVHDPNARFADFRAQPHAVRTSLEDFAPYAHQPAVDRFYQLVEWMNGSDTIWETTESKFWPLSTHTNKFFSGYNVTCSGRLVFFCRDYRWQCRHSDWAFGNLLAQLVNRQPTVANSCVGVFAVTTLFSGLSDDGGQTAPECQALGVRCYGFGNSEDEAFDGFGAGVDGVRAITESLANMITVTADFQP